MENYNNGKATELNFNKGSVLSTFGKLQDPNKRNDGLKYEELQMAMARKQVIETNQYKVVTDCYACIRDVSSTEHYRAI